MSDDARFTINGSPATDPVTGDQGYDAIASETLTCTLEDNPSGVLSTRFQVFDPNDTDSPLASLDAPNLTWNENGQASYLLPSPNANATIDIPASGVYSYIIRCTVSTPSGEQVFERLVALKGGSVRAFIPAESTQYRARGYADDLTAAAIAAGLVKRYDFSAGDSGLASDEIISQVYIPAPSAAATWSFKALVGATAGRSVLVTLRDVTQGTDLFTLGPTAAVVPVEVAQTFAAPSVNTLYAVKVRLDTAVSNADRAVLYEAAIEL